MVLKPLDVGALSPRTGGQLASKLRKPPALYLCEIVDECDDYGNILSLLSDEEIRTVLGRATLHVLPAGAPVFTQGERYDSIWIIENGGVRVYYTSPSGREFTLAYWGPGQYVGVPELFQAGSNLWSSHTTEPSRLYLLRGADIRYLLSRIPAFAIALTESLVFKGRCLSAILQILSTRSMQSRLARLILTLPKETDGSSDLPVMVRRAFTHEEFANIIGSTRQWVTATMKRLESRKLIYIRDKRICVLDPARLSVLAD
jgi:CRP-like cAMP-binding protein